MTLIALALSSPPTAAASPLVLAGHSSWVNAVAVGDDVVATAGNDGQIGIWRLADGARLAWLHLPRPHPVLGESALLAHLGVPTPPLYGITSEQVLERSES